MKFSNTYLLLTLAVSFFTMMEAKAQCALSADAGPDIIICAPGENVTLNGSATGAFGNVQWTPADGMTSPNSLSTDVFVSTTTTFTLTVSGGSATSNLILDGNFSGGGVFSSEYIPATGGPWGPLSNEGEYAIGANSGVFHVNWDPCADHTGGGGNMMVVNGSTTPNESIWCQTVTVTPNTVYEFGTWVASVLSDNPAELQFSINGELLGSTFNAPSSPCTWSQFFETWNSDDATTATICITNQNTVAGGNDFALDDITFGPVCSDLDEVTVTVVDVDALAEPLYILPCVFGSGININGFGSTVGPGVTYEWTTMNGNIVSGANTLNPLVDANGIYQLVVTLTAGTTVCTESAFVEVTPDIDIPTAEIAQPIDLSCTQPISLLDGIGSSVGGNIQYSWTTIGGGFSGPTTDLQANATQPGTYILTVTNILNGCTDDATIEVGANYNFPSANAVASGTLNCTNTTVSISGTGSSPSGLEYDWSTTGGGNITSATDIPVITVNAPGIYELTVTNSANGCSDTELVVVSANTGPPNPSIATPGTLNCTATTATLNASGSTGTGTLSFSWSTTGGNIVSGGQTASPVVNAVGTYTVTVTQSSNGCSATASVQVTGDNNLPTITIATPGQLTCSTDEINLSATTTGANLTYTWTTNGGSIVSGATSLTPTVDTIGTYTLTVTQANGCSAVSSVQVTNNLTPPVAEAGPAPMLNCQSPSAALNGTGSANGAGIGYVWTTLNGIILSGGTTLAPQIMAAGTYYLTVLDTLNGCSSTDSVVVLQNSSLPNTSIALPDTLNCNAETLVLNAGTSSSGTGFTMVWTTTGGHFAADDTTLTPTVDAPGVYTLTITSTASGCSTTASVTVADNFNTPAVSAAAPELLTCDLTSQLLDATASTFGASGQITWTTQDGSIVDGANTLTPEIDAPGIYRLIIRDMESGCADTTQITVLENVAFPTASTGLGDDLTCTVTSLTLDGSGSSQGANFQYIWTTSNGNIVDGADGLSPLIDAPGTYILTVENTDNGCTNVASVSVGQDGDFPSVSPAAAPPLTCNLTETTLNATANIGSEFSYTWTTADGNILEDETTLTPLVDAPGEYVLTVLNSQNGCTSTASVMVVEDVAAPTADAGSPGVLSCTMTQMSLSGSGSAAGSVGYLWTTSNGNILSGETTPSPTVNAPGTYTLTVTNNANGCTEAASVVISQDASLPTANAGTTDDLTCIVNSVTLDGSASSQGPAFSYLWTTQNGVLQGDETTLTPVAAAPGTYLLTVTNTASNCTTISSVTVALDNAQPIADPGTDGLLTCTTTQLTLDGNGSSAGSDFSYLWTTSNGLISNGQTSLTPLVTEPGDYALQVTNNENGCVSTNSITINENTTPPAAAAATPGELTCIAQNLNLSGNGSSMGANFGYLWATTNGNILSGPTTISPSVNEPGLYVLTVTNSLTGCTNTAQVQVLEDVATPTASAGPTATLTCDAPTFSLNGTGSSQGAIFGYVWSTINGNIVSGVTTLAPVIDADGNYLLTVTNGDNGCTATSSVAIQVNQTEPTVAIVQPTDLTCVEQTTGLDGNGSSTGSQFVYNWTTVSGHFTGPQDALQTTVDEPGTYTLTIENTVNGCESSDQITVDEDVDNPLADAGQALELNCNETESNLQGSTDLPTGAWLANWSTTDGSLTAGASGLTPTVDAPGTYLLTVTNAATGCTATDAVTVTAIIFDDFDFEMLAPTCLTNLGSIEFTDMVGGTPPFQYSVNGGASFSNQSVAVGLAPGSYDLVVQDANGCELTDVTNLPEPPEALVTLDADIIINLGDSYQLNALTNLPSSAIELVQWSPAATLSCSDCLSPMATPVQQTSYQVKVTSKEGCTAEDVITVFVKKDVDIYVPNAFSPNGDGTNDVFMIFAGGNGVQKIRSFLVFDRWGETVYQYYDFEPNNPAYGWNGKLHDEPMNSAVYVWFAEAELVDGSVKLLKGDVNLLR